MSREPVIACRPTVYWMRSPAHRRAVSGDPPPPGPWPRAVAGGGLCGGASHEAEENRSPKTVNNVLTVLNTLLKQAVAWDVIETVPCTIRLLKAPRAAVRFHDFEAFERLVVAADRLDRTTLLLVLLGGEAGLRCGERCLHRSLLIRQPVSEPTASSASTARLRQIPWAGRSRTRARRPQRYVA